MKVKESVITFLLGHFREKPGMYLGRNHISLLSIFMTGYMISLTNNGFDITTDPFFGKEDEGFFSWYKKKMGYKTSSNWYIAILNDTGENEEEALNSFLKLLEQFKKEVLEAII